MTTIATAQHSHFRPPEFMRNKMFAINMILAAIWLLSIPFCYYALTKGAEFVFTGESTHKSFHIGGTVNGYAIGLHMMAGAVINFLLPLQIYLGLTHKYVPVHRLIGLTGIIVAFTGAFVGTMFFLMYPDGETKPAFSYQAGSMYGVIMFYTVFKLCQTLVNRNYAAHQEWAVRLFVLAIGSYISRCFSGWHGLGIELWDFSDTTNVYLHFFRNWFFHLIPIMMVQFYYVMKHRNAFAKWPEYTAFFVALVGVIYFAVGTAAYVNGCAFYSSMAVGTHL